MGYKLVIMKILYIANIRFPSNRAHAVQMVNMCNAFSEIGAEVLFAVSDRDTNILESPEEYYGTRLKFEVKKYKVGNLLKGKALTFHLSSIWLFLKVFMSYRKKTFDLVFSREELLIFLFSLFVKAEKLAWESHQAKNNFLVRRLMKKGVHCICISEGIKNFYISTGICEDKLHVAHDGIDSSFFDVSLSKNEAKLNLGLDIHK